MVTRPKILISACLVGQYCRYDGGTCPLSAQQLEALERHFEPVPFCPEVEGGLPTPRVPAEIQGGAGVHWNENKPELFGSKASGREL